MPVYQYKAINPAGQLRSGTLTADTAFAGRQVLRQGGWQIREFEVARTTGRRRWPNLRRKRQTDELAGLARNLALLLRAGVPLTEALDVLSQQYPGQLRASLQDVREQVNSGSSLAEAMGRHTDLFDVVWQSAVHVGEVSGTLDVSLRELGQYLEARHNLRSRLSALIYPVILLCMATGIVIFLMRFVVPQILQVLIASGRPLPASTKILMHLSSLLIDHWLATLAILGGTLAALVAIPRTTPGRRYWHRRQLQLPILGPLLRKAIVAEYAQMSAMLLRSNVPFTQAMKAIQTTARHEVLKEELGRIITSVEAGSNIAVAMTPTRLFPPLVIHLMAVGQDTGELTEMLEQLRGSYDEEVRLAAVKFNATLEPLLIILIAGIVGFIVFATIMPILEAARAIH